MSDARKRVRPVLDWLESIDPDTVFLSVVTLGEIHKGIVRQEERSKTSAGGPRAWLDDVRARHQSRILHVNEPIALAWGRIVAGRTRNMADALIAATAQVHGLALVTRNIRDFDDLDIPLVNPWTAN